MNIFRHAFIAIAIGSLFSSPVHANDDTGVNAIYGRLVDAARNNDATKFDTIYELDSVYMGANIPPIIGKDDIRSAFISSWTKARGDGAMVDLQFRLVQRIWHSDSAVTDIGYSKFSFIYDDKSKEPRVSYSKFVTLAQRKKDGTWVWRIDIDNTQSPKTGAAEFEALRPVGQLRYDE